MGWRELITDLEDQLTEITGYDQVSLQPNAGSQGELAACWPSAATTCPGAMTSARSA
ncbi:glycine dehydrogenase [decarboxylating] [Arthrobacter sp. Hiyo4]|nr:glycine dehydrogenase [decarboxylating] [Arthrobacter sp. Hiyo4]